MLPDRVSNPGPLTYESGALPIALAARRTWIEGINIFNSLSSNLLSKLVMGLRLAILLQVLEHMVGCLPRKEPQ